MDNKLLKQNIIDYIDKLITEKLLYGTKDVLSVRVDDNSFLVTPLDTELKNVKIEDIVKVNMSDNLSGEYDRLKCIYKARADINAIIHIYPKHCVTIANAGLNIPAVLDDMAQIVGPSAKSTKNSDNSSVIKTLKGRNCCFIKGDGVISTGRTMDESFVGCLVLEKAAQVYVEASVLGGAKVINIIEAKLMRFIYKKKYSKADQTRKMEEVKKEA